VLYERDNIEVEREIVYEGTRPVASRRKRSREREIERGGEFYTIPVEREAMYERLREREVEFEEIPRTRPVASKRERSRERNIAPKRRNTVAVDPSNSSKNLFEDAIVEDEYSDTSDYVVRRRDRRNSRTTLEDDSGVRRDSDPEDYVIQRRVGRSRSPNARAPTPLGAAAGLAAATAFKYAARNIERIQSPNYPERSRSRSRERMQSPYVKSIQTLLGLTGFAPKIAARQPLESERDVRETDVAIEERIPARREALDEGVRKYRGKMEILASQSPEELEEKYVLGIRRRGRESDRRRERSRSLGYSDRRRLPAKRRKAPNRERSRSLDGGEQKGARGKASAIKKERRDLNPNIRRSVGSKDSAAEEPANSKDGKSFISKVATGLGLKKPALKAV
jgi:hypothetical protein